MSTLMNKKNLNSKQLQLLQGEMASRRKSPTAMWMLWGFGGAAGAHRFYVGKTGTAIAQFFTAGGLGIWTLIDAFKINSLLDECNAAIELDIIQEITAHTDAAAQSERKAAAAKPESADAESMLV